MIDPHANPMQERDGKWYWFDDLGNRIGPYATERAALSRLLAYCHGINGTISQEVEEQAKPVRAGLWLVLAGAAIVAVVCAYIALVNAP